MKEKRNWEREGVSREEDELNPLLEELKYLKKEISQCPDCSALEKRLSQLEGASAKERAEEIKRIKKELESLKKRAARSGKIERQNPETKTVELKAEADKWREQAASAVEELVSKAVPKFLR